MNFFFLYNSILTKKVKKSCIFLFVLKIFVYLQKILNISEQNKKIKEKTEDNINKTIGNCN